MTATRAIQWRKLVSNKTRKYAESLLDNLIDLDHQTTGAFYEMGQILSAIRQHQLYKILGYTSFTSLIDEELSFTASTATRYASLYTNLRRLHYNKVESLKLLQKVGFTHLSAVLPNMTTKIGRRAINKRVNAIDAHQINFTVTEAELVQLQKALTRMGATVTKTGWVTGSSQALMGMVGIVNKRPKLKAVA